MLRENRQSGSLQLYVYNVTECPSCTLKELADFALRDLKDFLTSPYYLTFLFFYSLVLYYYLHVL
jgi:hypothetical protein